MYIATIGSKYPDDWNKRRRRVYRRDNYICQSCGDRGGNKGNAELHAHHKKPISEGGGHKLNNLTTLCSGCHEDEHGHPIFAGGNNSGTDSGWNLFSLGIQNLGAYTESTSSTTNSGHTHENTEPEKLDTFGKTILIGPFLTFGLFVFMSMFWIALFDGEGFLFAIGALIVVLLILGIPLLIISVIAGLIPALIIYGIDEFLFAEIGWGRDLNDVEQMYYLAASLSSVIFFNISLFRASFTEATLVNSLWPATWSAILGWIIVLILTKIFLWWFLSDSNGD